MGRNHVRAYRELLGTQLVGVADQNLAVASAVAELHGCAAYGDHRQLLSEARPEAVSVAVSTAAHFEVVRDCLQSGAHVLVEKPIAPTLEEAAQLVACAGEAGRVLMVGHIERFNPAVIELKRRLDASELGPIFSAKAQRIGPFPPRVRDVGVVIDLATHDLDVMRYLFRSEVTRVYAETRREVHTLAEDMVNALIRFENGIIGSLEINWLTPTKVRELTVTGKNGMFKADYLTQDLLFFENADQGGDRRWNPLSVLRGVREGPMTRYAIDKQEPLKNELTAFLEAASGSGGSAASAEDGTAALRLALALIESGRTGRVVELGHG